jgi:hypothetical protein
MFHWKKKKKKKTWKSLCWANEVVPIWRQVGDEDITHTAPTRSGGGGSVVAAAAAAAAILRL